MMEPHISNLNMVPIYAILIENMVQKVWPAMLEYYYHILKVSMNDYENRRGVGFYFFKVPHIFAGSPADRGGLKVGDVLLEVNEVNVAEKSVQELREIITTGGAYCNTVNLPYNNVCKFAPEMDWHPFHLENSLQFFFKYIYKCIEALSI